MNELPPISTTAKRKGGYKTVLDRYPDLAYPIQDFERWFLGVDEWLTWVETHIPDNVYASRTEVLEEFHFTSQGLELLERLNLDVYPEGRDIDRVEYDVKKLLRTVITLPTIARLSGKHLDRKGQNITTIFKEIIEETILGCPKVAPLKDNTPETEPTPSEV